MVFSFSFLATLLFTVLVIPFFSSLSRAAPHPFSTPGIKARSSFNVRQQEDPCAVLFADNDVTVFLAEDAYNCLITVPFNTTIGAQFTQYLRDTYVFQSTLTYLKSPPPSYQQPGVDLLSAFDVISANISAGYYQNEYDFEAAIQEILYAAHDGHVDVDAGILAVFTFGSAYAISSVSIDGIQIPQVYLTEDLVNARNGSGYMPSPIKTINGEDVTQWLTSFASLNSFGLLDPNADWNALMYSAASDIQGSASAFTGQSSFYPGNNLDFVLENGTELSTQWLSLLNVPYGTPSISNGQDVFDIFVTDDIPEDDGNSTSPNGTTSSGSSSTNTPSPTTSDGSAASGTAAANSSSDGDDAMPTSWGIPAYPDNPDVVQPDLGFGGFITGYFLNDSGIAVLSIPSFEMTGSAIADFSNTVGEFIQRAQEAGLTKIVIDLQQNDGGEVLLATDVFKQFFPPVDPFGGSRLRSFNYSDALGTTYTQYYGANTLNQTYANEFLDIPWAVLDYIDANNNQNFTSWPELFGPHSDHGDFFSTVQRDNISSSLFDEVATGGYDDDDTTPAGIVIYGYGNRSTSTQPPFAPENIILLTDGVCHSACAVFVEMMHHEAFVRTVVVGGRPNIGPMQAVAGTRGALEYNTDDLDNDIYFATVVNSSITNQLPASHVTEDLLFWITYAEFNLRDQIRQGPNNYFPLQFAYEAADCRIYWTMSTFNNFENLWKYAAEAVWTNSNLCVNESTNYPTTRSGVDSVGPTTSQKTSWGAVIPGQPQTTTSTTSAAILLPFPDYLDSTPPSSSNNPILSYSDSNTPPPSSGDIEDDSIDLKSTTLDKHCNIKSRNSCSPRSNEVCLAVSTCQNGATIEDTQCKRQCTSTSQCSSSNGQATFCNTLDQQCSFGANGKAVCGTLKSLQQQSGSGARRSTVSGGAGGSQTRNALAGFCEPVVKTDAKCLQLEGSGNGPVPPMQSLAALAQNGVTSVVVDTPTTPQQQSQTNNDPTNVDSSNVKRAWWKMWRFS